MYACSFFLIPQSISGWICLSLDFQPLSHLRLLPLEEVFPKIGGTWSHLPAPWDQPLSLGQSLKPGTPGLRGWAILTPEYCPTAIPLPAAGCPLWWHSVDVSVPADVSVSLLNRELWGEGGVYLIHPCVPTLFPILPPWTLVNHPMASAGPSVPHNLVPTWDTVIVTIVRLQLCRLLPWAHATQPTPHRIWVLQHTHTCTPCIQALQCRPSMSISCTSCSKPP